MPLKDSYSALIAQAEALEKYGRLDDALEIYERVVKRLSKVSDETFSKRDELRTYLVKAGVSAIGIPRGQGDFDRALEIIAILENSVLARETDIIGFMRVQVTADAGRIDEAMELLHTIADGPDVEARHRLDYTVEALWNDRPEDALRLVEAIDMDALQTEETDAGDADEEDEDEDAGAKLFAQAWFMRFRIYAKLGQLEEAEAAWNEARQAAPDDPPGSVEIIEVFLEHEDYEKALHYADMDGDMYRRGTAARHSRCEIRQE